MNAKEILNRIKNNKIQFAIQKEDGSIYCNKDTNNIMDIFGLENEEQHIYGVYTDIFDNTFTQYDNRNTDDDFILAVIDKLLEFGEPVDRSTLSGNITPTYVWEEVLLDSIEFVD
ncbi:TPA: hypothetical protein ACGO8V_002332 [Streptococcus suis]